MTVTVGPGIDDSGLRVPQNASVHAWLDHDEVLASASLLVGHGGHSTAMRALSFGVPQVIMPANPMIDQKLVGAALQDRRAGLLLPKHSAPKRIRLAVDNALRNASYGEAAQSLGDDIRRSDGAEVAAEKIVDFVRQSAEFTPTRG